MRATAVFAGVAAAIGLLWWWLGHPLAMPPSPLAAGERLHCLSYAPFRADQTPLDLTTRISPEQIDDDLARLAKVTGCVRTYSTNLGLDRIADLAGKHGLTVIQGIWLGSEAERNRREIAAAVEIARRNPGVVSAIVVGNEVLLRGEMTALDLAAAIRAVKAQVSVPVTYADVWEFWLRHRDLGQAADFVTIHILPYWEDFPVAAAAAAAHVADIRAQVAAAFAGKDVLIGEVGWPSAGRMREGALPSPANQARVLHEVLNGARAGQYRVNLIEAFDQPWKRRLEGTVGGHWGLLGARDRAAKFTFGAPVSNHPHWLWQALAGIALAGAVVAVGSRRAGAGGLSPSGLARIAVVALAAGGLVGWGAENALVESLGPGGWLRSAAAVGLAIGAPLAGAAAIGEGRAVAVLWRVVGRAPSLGDPGVWLGFCLVGLVLLALHVMLGLVFDPRYKDFPFAPLSAAAVALALVPVAAGPGGRAVLTERIAASALLLATIYVVPNEMLSNWQSLWLCGAVAVLAVTLLRLRDAPGSG